MDLDARAESQLHQLTEALATMQAFLKGMQDQLPSELVKVRTVSFISISFAKNWLSSEGYKMQSTLQEATSREPLQC
jgi:hypothetical protein